MPAPAGGGYFFATGIAFDRSVRRWHLGFHHVQNINPDATTHLDLAVFDEGFNLLEHQHGPSGHRPHFLLLDSILYMIYDRGGVFLSRYQVRGQGFLPPVPATLYFPMVILNDAHFTGLAVVNSGDAAARLTFAAYDSGGNLAGLGWLNNPLDLPLPAKAQLARLLTELFGPAFHTDGGWVQVSSDQAGVQAFFMSFDLPVETLDGSTAVDRPLSYFLFPFLDNAEIALVNPGSDPEAVATLRRFNDGGQATGELRVIPIAPRASRILTSADLPPASGGYIAVHSAVPLAAAARFADPAGMWECALNALDGNAGGRVLVLPQYVFDDSYRTILTVVNLDDSATDLRLRLVNDEGEAVGKELTLPLPARGRTVLDNPGPFEITPGGTAPVSLWIGSSATRVSGAVRFGDAQGKRFQTVLPLQAEAFKEVLYAQVAEDETYFTGVAMVNAGQQRADVQLSVFNAAGAVVASGSASIPPQGRISKLLWELVPSLPQISGGYFTVTSSEPLYGFAAFGTYRLSAMATVPAQALTRAGYAGAAPEGNYIQVNPDSDFVPPRGGVPGGPGPAMGRLMVAKSPDGLLFTRTNRIVTDQGAVPDMVVDKNGMIYLYYTGWVVGDQINKTAVAISRDGGEAWAFRKLDLRRNPGESDLVDPDVLILDDGTFRLYTTSGGNNQYPRTHYSDSADGIHFERKGVAFDPGSQALDPSAIRVGLTYHLFAGGAGDPEVNWHGASYDAAVYGFDRQMIFRFDGFGQMMANGLQADGGYRFYCFGNNRAGGAATQQLPARRRAPSGGGSQARWLCCSPLTYQRVCSSLAPRQRA